MKHQKYITFPLLLFFWISVAWGEASPQNSTTDLEVAIDKIMILSGLDNQMPRYSQRLINAEDFQDYLETLPYDQRSDIQNIINTAFEGSAMLETLRNNIKKGMSLPQARVLLDWYQSEDGRKITAIEETPRGLDDLEEVFKLQKELQTEDRLLSIDMELVVLCKKLIKAAFVEKSNFMRELTFRKTLFKLTTPEMSDKAIEKKLSNLQYEIGLEENEFLLASIVQLFKNTDKQLLNRYLSFLQKDETQAYLLRNIEGVQRAVDEGAQKMIQGLQKIR